MKSLEKAMQKIESRNAHSSHYSSEGVWKVHTGCKNFTLHLIVQPTFFANLIKDVAWHFLAVAFVKIYVKSIHNIKAEGAQMLVKHARL